MQSLRTVRWDQAASQLLRLVPRAKVQHDYYRERSTRRERGDPVLSSRCRSAVHPTARHGQKSIYERFRSLELADDLQLEYDELRDRDFLYLARDLRLDLTGVRQAYYVGIQPSPRTDEQGPSSAEAQISRTRDWHCVRHSQGSRGIFVQATVSC